MRIGLPRRTFAALAVRNYRLYFTGQVISLAGTWMQAVAQTWLVLELSHSGTVLGFTVAAQFLPVLLLGTYGGLIADRIDKRRLLIGTQSALAVLAVILGGLAITGAVRLWMVIVLAALLGLVNAFDNPARQSFAAEMVGPDLVRNAVTLNSVMMNVARVVGPSIAGVLIATSGVGVCFLINAASFAAVLIAFVRMDPSRLTRGVPASRLPGQVRDGLRYVRATPELFAPLVMMALVGTLAFEFSVVLPVMARDTFQGNAATYGLMSSAMGVGAIVGGLMIASRAATGLPHITAATFGFGLAIGAAALAPSLPWELLSLLLVGIGSVAFLSLGNATLQTRSAPRYRGRVMALWSVAFLGSTPIGGPIIGAVAEHVSPRGGLLAGAAACGLAGIIGLVAVAGGRRTITIAPGEDGLGG